MVAIQARSTIRRSAPGRLRGLVRAGRGVSLIDEDLALLARLRARGGGGARARAPGAPSPGAGGPDGGDGAARGRAHPPRGRDHGHRRPLGSAFPGRAAAGRGGGPRGDRGEGPDDAGQRGDAPRGDDRPAGADDRARHRRRQRAHPGPAGPLLAPALRRPAPPRGRGRVAQPPAGSAPGSGPGGDHQGRGLGALRSLCSRRGHQPRLAPAAGAGAAGPPQRQHPGGRRHHALAGRAAAGRLGGVAHRGLPRPEAAGPRRRRVVRPSVVRPWGAEAAAPLGRRRRALRVRHRGRDGGEPSGRDGARRRGARRAAVSPGPRHPAGGRGNRRAVRASSRPRAHRARLPHREE